ncbi:MAG: hypothetical protein KAU44_06660 [Candidatus Marinimicrobia bacterium]|nr:hypothetical protein [Candidatus Neomarinimicrobiota bacterium]
MDHILTFLEKEIKSYLNLVNAIKHVLENFLFDHNIILNSKQRKEFVYQDNEDKILLKLRLNKKQIKKSSFKTKNDIIVETQKYIDEVMESNLLRYYDVLDKNIPHAAKESINAFTEQIINNLKNSFGSLLKEIDLLYGKNRKLIYEKYREEIQIFNIIIKILSEAFLEINNNARKANKKDEALVRILGESSLVAQEIYVLLIHGYPDGAFARWRKLYEQSIIVQILSKHDEEVSAMYLDHLHISNYFTMIEHKKHIGTLKREFYSEEKEQSITKIYSDLIKKYGNKYKYEYGWALKIINSDKITLQKLEKEAGYEHLRLYYKFSCDQVHASSKGMKYRLGLPIDGSGNILFGASTLGLNDPIQLSLISLQIISIVVSNYMESYQGIITTKIINELLGDLFKIIEKKASNF